MSGRSKRDRRRERGASWLGDSPASEEENNRDLAENTAGIYGLDGLDLGGSTRITVKSIDLHSIQPDPTQPRRAVPSAVRAAVDPTQAADLLAAWIGQSALDENTVAGLVNGDEHLMAEPEGEDHLSDFDPLTLSLLKVIEIAASIKRDGLTNPITVIKRDGRYEIETGERRWLAYHLLNMTDPDGDWAHIPARVMDDFSVWRQATENTARDDLNGVARARQLALLLMDLHKRDGAQFEPLSAFEHEQDFYAQVADGNTWRVPRGKGQALVQAMGLSGTGQVRQYRAILRLPREVWVHADDNDWTEFEIRNIDGATVTGVTVADDEQAKDKPKKRKPSLIKRFADQQIPTIEKTLRQLKGKDRDKAITYLRQLLEKIEAEK